MPAAAIDILVVGGGPVGCSFALALRSSAQRVVVLERESDGARAAAPRPLALSYASRLILERIGAWDALAPSPIETILVSQAGGFGRARLDAADAGVPALGYVLEYRELACVLAARLESSGIEVRRGADARALPARCVVHAEGGSEDARAKRYAQDAVVGVVETEPRAGTTAIERFTPEGPLALLPLAGRFAFVWGTRPERARALAEAAPEVFLEQLAHAAGARLGRALAVHARAVHALALRVRASRVGTREVYIGNAAQTLHPVAGQGLNLGLRDAWELAALLQGVDDPGDPAVLGRFAARRRLDAGATIRVTDFLARGFIGRNPAASAVRGFALTLLDTLPPARRFFARRMIYGPSALP
ncbi:MAG TPA: FAD-dependent monooxygenase [Burkholderiales bacterium]|nr:FAD-dependent monooxygenase [Burkholderiales bacterium]